MNAWNENSDEKEIHFCARVYVCSAIIMTLWRNDTLWSNALFRRNTCQNCARATLEMRAQMSYSIQLLSTQIYS